MLLIINWECVKWHNIEMKFCVLWLAVILNAFIRTPQPRSHDYRPHYERWKLILKTVYDVGLFDLLPRRTPQGDHIYIIIIIYQYDLRAIYHIWLLLRSWDVVGLYIYIYYDFTFRDAVIQNINIYRHIIYYISH